MADDMNEEEHLRAVRAWPRGALNSWRDFTDPATKRSWTISFDFVYDKGVAAWVNKLTLEQRDGKPITAEAIRKLPWGELIGESRQSIAEDLRAAAAEVADDHA